jgi:hypothetical protein
MGMFPSLGIGENVRKFADKIIQKIQKPFSLEHKGKRIPMW